MSVEWTAPAVVLEVRPHGEGGAVVSLLTEEHGRHAGLAKGGASRAQSGLWMPGNLVEARWVARLPDQLGALSGEMVHPAAALAMEDPLALALLSCACAIAADALPEREPHPRAFRALVSLIGHLAGGAEGVMADYVRWEALVLSELGYGLNLDTCAVTGVHRGPHPCLPAHRPRGQRRRRAALCGPPAAAAVLPARWRKRGRRVVLGGRAAPDRPFPRTRRLRRPPPPGARGAAPPGRPGGGARRIRVSGRKRERSTNPSHARRHQGPARRRCHARNAARRGAVRALSRLCAVHHHRALAARCARRAEAGAPPPALGHAPAAPRSRRPASRNAPASSAT